MDELDAGREFDMAVAAIAAQPRRGQGQHRPQPLAAGGDDMAGKLRDQRHRAVHALDDGAVHQGEIATHQGRQLIERSPFAVPLFFQVDNNGHKILKRFARTSTGLNSARSLGLRLAGGQVYKRLGPWRPGRRLDRL